MMYLQFEELTKAVCFGEMTEVEAEEIALEILLG